MERGECRPQPVLQTFGEGGTSQPGGATEAVAALVAGKRGQLNIPDVNEYALMWSDLKLETGRGRVPAAIHETIVHVSRGLDFVLFQRLRPTQQESIRRELAELQQEEGIDHLTLTYAEGQLVRDAAAVVNAVYDPGTPEDTPENRAKRTFTFVSLLEPQPSVRRTVFESGKGK
jgi:hypothetical protein